MRGEAEEGARSVRGSLCGFGLEVVLHLSPDSNLGSNSLMTLRHFVGLCRNVDS